jgi:hypothetical protein
MNGAEEDKGEAMRRGSGQMIDSIKIDIGEQGKVLATKSARLK